MIPNTCALRRRRFSTFAVSTLVVAVVLAGGRRVLVADPQAPPIPVLGIYDVTICTKNVAEMGAFYDKLGLRRSLSNDKIIVYSQGGQDLAIVTSDSRPKAVMAVTFFVSDLQPVMTNLRRQGIPFDGPKPEHAFLTGVEVVDPNGNKVDFDLPRR